MLPSSSSLDLPSASPSQQDLFHQNADRKSVLVLIPNKIDVAEESRLYDALCTVCSITFAGPCHAQDKKQLQDHDVGSSRNRSSPTPPSIISRDIWLGDNSGESLTFARDVKISGWTHVGDKLGGAYIGDALTI
jgi:hypothetical protein